MSDSDLLSRLRSLGIQIEPEWEGKIQRHKSQWLASSRLTYGGKVYQVASFGDWKNGVAKEVWRSWKDGSVSDPALVAQLDARLKAQNEARRKAKYDYQERQAIKLWDEWEALRSAGGHIDRCPYATKKGIGESFGARLEPQGAEASEVVDMCNLIVPMFDIDGKFWNFQRITSTNKRFQLGARVNGCFHVLQGSGLVELSGAHEIYVCEGFATAASVARAVRGRESGEDVSFESGQNQAGADVPGGAEASDGGADEPDGGGTNDQTYKGDGTPNRSVVCTFSATGLKMAAQAIHQRYAHVKIVLAGDNDEWTVINGEPTNVGRLACVDASTKIGAKARFVVPTFKTPGPGLSDWNDLELAQGLDEVRLQIFKTTPSDSVKEEPSPADAGSSPPSAESESEPKAKRKNAAKKYSDYEAFFASHLKGSRRDVVSGRLVIFDGHQWQPCLADLEATKSYATSAFLNEAKVKMHFHRYIAEQQKELLVPIQKWDGEDRIHGLNKILHFKNPEDFPVFEDAFKEWGANIFRRLYHSGAQNRCIILKGDQGIGKDFLIRSMLQGFGPYYAKFTNSRDDREIWDQVTGRLVVHIEEFEQTGTMTIAFLKDLITRDWATYRSPYAHDASTRKCVGSFISTANIDAPLRDSTGNRRFAVFEVAGIRWGYPQDWGPQIMAQFKALFEADFRAVNETWEKVSFANTRFEIVDMVPEILNMWDTRLANIFHNGSAKGIVELNFEEISVTALEISRGHQISLQKLLTIVKTSGRSVKRKDGARYWSNLIRVTAPGSHQTGCGHPGGHHLNN